MQHHIVYWPATDCRLWSREIAAALQEYSPSLEVERGWSRRRARAYLNRIAGPSLGEMVARPSGERLGLPVSKPSRPEEAGIPGGQLAACCRSQRRCSDRESEPGSRTKVAKGSGSKKTGPETINRTQRSRSSAGSRPETKRCSPRVDRRTRTVVVQTFVAISNASGRPRPTPSTCR